MDIFHQVNTLDKICEFLHQSFWSIRIKPLEIKKKKRERLLFLALKAQAEASPKEFQAHSLV